jgi:excisionase family DNA binding protein
MSVPDVEITLPALPALCTLKEAASALRMSTRTVQRYIACGRLRAARLDSGSSRLLIPRAELERLIRESML